ncbi:MAG: TonB family protein [Deltaproteobacteria bacterium]|jgi:protein TonB|nr:TonB family protein [Deltaproteobacteria bacterium]
MSFQARTMLAGDVRYLFADRYRQASRLSSLFGLAAGLTLAGLFILRPPDLWETEAFPPDPAPITMEIMAPPPPPPVIEEIIAEPPPEPLPAPVVPMDLSPPEEVVPEPIEDKNSLVEPEPEPEKKERPRPRERPGPPRPVVSEAAAPPAETPVPAATAAPRAGGARERKFVREFLRLVEKSKFYPNEARRAGLTGTVKVRVGFDGGGNISGVSLVQGDHDPVLGQAALTTMERVRSRYSPKEGSPDSVVVPIVFQLKG